MHFINRSLISWLCWSQVIVICLVRGEANGSSAPRHAIHSQEPDMRGYQPPQLVRRMVMSEDKFSQADLRAPRPWEIFMTKLKKLGKKKSEHHSPPRNPEPSTKAAAPGGHARLREWMDARIQDSARSLFGRRRKGRSRKHKGSRPKSDTGQRPKTDRTRRRLFHEYLDRSSHRRLSRTYHGEQAANGQTDVRSVRTAPATPVKPRVFQKLRLAGPSADWSWSRTPSRRRGFRQSNPLFSADRSVSRRNGLRQAIEAQDEIVCSHTPLP